MVYNLYPYSKAKKTVAEYLAERNRVRENALNTARMKTREVQEKSRWRVEQKKLAEPFQVGQRVGYKTPRLRHKLASPWDPDYKIDKVISAATYVISNDKNDNAKLKVVNTMLKW